MPYDMPLDSAEDIDQSSFQYDTHRFEQEMEQLSGFSSDEQSEESTNILNTGEVMSGIGRVISQTEASMDFTTNLEAPLEGLQKRKQRLSSNSSGNAHAVDDMSMSRFAESYWKRSSAPPASNPQEATEDDLRSMEFSTQSAGAVNGYAATAPNGPYHNRSPANGENSQDVQEEEETISDSFLAHARAQHQQPLPAARPGERRTRTFASDSNPPQQQFTSPLRPLPRRPDSYHEFTTIGNDEEPLPTFSSPRPAKIGLTRGMAQLSFKDSASASEQPPWAIGSPDYDPTPMISRPISGHSTDADFGKQLTDSFVAKVRKDFETRRDEAMPSGEKNSPGYIPSHLVNPYNVMRERFLNGPSHHGSPNSNSHNEVSEAAEPADRADSPPAWPDPNGDDNQEQQQQQQTSTFSYRNQPPGLYRSQRRFSREIRESIKSGDHNNIGSQSSDDSLHEFRAEPEDYYNDIKPNGIGDGVQYVNIGDDDSTEDFGQNMINSFGDSSNNNPYDTKSPNPYEGYRSGRSSIALEAEIKASTNKGDNIFGERADNLHSSNPELSDIVRDHEQVFSDLFTSDEENGNGEEEDPTKPPASLFASSASIIAEMSRRKRNSTKKSHTLSTWDGKDATPDRLRLQEQQVNSIGVHPIEMLEKANSLGISDRTSDVSGILPTSEFSPKSIISNDSSMNSRFVQNKGRADSNVQRQARPPKSNVPNSTPRKNHLNGVLGGAAGAPPPTTPTTFIARDTQHRPSSRVLHQVPPFEALNSNAANKGKAADSGFATASNGNGNNNNNNNSNIRARRPAGPRNIHSSASSSTAAASSSNVGQRNARAAFDFASAATAQEPSKDLSANFNVNPDASNGLGSLFQDSLPNLNLSLLSKTPNTPFRAISRILNTPRSSPKSPFKNNTWNSINSSSLMGSNINYVPFQDPTVDIDCLPKYQQLDLETGEGASEPNNGQYDTFSSSASQRRSGISANKGVSGNNLAIVGERDLNDYDHSGYGFSDDDDLVPTVKYDSTNTTNSPAIQRLTPSPTLKDIYQLLKTTVSKLESQQDGSSKSDVVLLKSIETIIRQNSAPAMYSQYPPQQQQAEGDGDRGSEMLKKIDSEPIISNSNNIGVEEVLDSEQQFADQSYPDIARPVAPTPRHARQGAQFMDWQQQQQQQSKYSPYDDFEDEEEGPLHISASAMPVVRRSETLPPNVPFSGQQQRGRSSTQQSRVQAYLQRHMSEAGMHEHPNEHADVSAMSVQPANQTLQEQQQQQQQIENDELLTLLTKVLSAGGDTSKADIPPSLLQRMPEIVSALSRIAASNSPGTTAVNNPGSGNAGDERSEIIKLQKELLTKFDECKTEVDLLRAEVRQGSTVISANNINSTSNNLQQDGTGGHRAANASTIAPQDSVSMVDINNNGGSMRRRTANGGAPEPAVDPLMTPSPRPDSIVRPMYTVPTTVKNKQRQMVQWLNEQGPTSNNTSPSSLRGLPAEDKSIQASLGSPRLARSHGRSQQPLRHDMMVYTTPSLGSRKIRRQGTPQFAASGQGGYRRTTIEDAEDEGEDEDEGYPRAREEYKQHGEDEDLVDMLRRKQAMGGANDNVDGDEYLSDTSTTVPDSQPDIARRGPIDPAMVHPPNIPSLRQLEGRRDTQRNKSRSLRGVAGAFNPWSGHEDLLETRKTLDSIRARNNSKSSNKADDFDSMLYSKEMVRQLADTLSELQRVHKSHFHRLGTKAEARSCPVCLKLEAQDKDPYLFGKHAVAYKSMTTRQLQGLLNAYVAAMEDEFHVASKLQYSKDDNDVEGMLDALEGIKQKGAPGYHSFTPTRKHNHHRKSIAAKDAGEDVQATKLVIELLRDELDALSRRYHRLVEEFHALNPSNVADQRRRRQMTRELKDLVDMLDVKGEQIAVLASLHPSPAGKAADSGIKKLSSTERAYQSARALQQALGDLY